MAFRSRLKVRFADIDRAGIVYYPRFFDFFHRALEDFFADEVRIPYHVLIDQRRVGFPIVHVESDFRHPLSHGDEIEVEVTAARIGRRSVTIRYRTYRPTRPDPAAVALITQVCIDMDSFRAIDVPAEIREAFARHIEP